MANDEQPKTQEPFDRMEGAETQEANKKFRVCIENAGFKIEKLSYGEGHTLDTMALDLEKLDITENSINSIQTSIKDADVGKVLTAASTLADRSADDSAKAGSLNALRELGLDNSQLRTISKVANAQLKVQDCAETHLTPNATGTIPTGYIDIGNP